MEFNPREFHPNISPIDVIKKEYVVEHILEIFILMLRVNFIKIVGKNLKN